MERTQQVQGIVFKKTEDGYKFLLLKRIKEKGGFWQPVSGGVDDRYDDNVLEGMHRELEEEIKLKPYKIIRLLPHIHEFTMDKHYITGEPMPLLTEYVFGIEVEESFEPDIEKNPCSEHQGYAWVTYNEALTLLKWEDNKIALTKLMEEHLK